MKGICTAVCFLFLLVGCGEDKDLVVPASQEAASIDVPAFMAASKLSFQGNLDGEVFNWLFASGEENYQSSRSFCYMGQQQACNPNRNFAFNLTQNTGTNTVQLRLPAINVTSKAEFNRVFGLGKKKCADYELNIKTGNRQLLLNNKHTTNELEILKTAEILSSNSEKVLRVWFRVKATLHDGTGSNANVPLEGLLLAEFSGYDFKGSACNSNN